MNTKIVIFVCCILTAIAENTTNVNKCDGNVPFPDSVVIMDKDIICVTPPCKVYKNSNIVLNISFIAKNYLEHIKPNMRATTAGIPIDWPLGNDACDFITSTICPIAAGERIVYQQNMYIGSFPPVGVNLQFSITDKDNNDAIVTCFSVDIVIVA